MYRQGRVIESLRGQSMVVFDDVSARWLWDNVQRVLISSTAQFRTSTMSMSVIHYLLLSKKNFPK